MTAQRVVITGVGAVTPIGNTAEEFWASLLQGRSGIGPITRFDTTGYPTRIAGELKGFDPLKYIDKKDDRKLDPYLKYAVACAQMAVDDAALKTDQLDSTRFGVLVGLRHRRDHDAARQPQRAPRQGARPRVAVLHPDAHHQHGAGDHLDAVRRRGPELLGGHGVRHRQPRDRRRDEDHPARRRRRDDRRRSRGHHHPAHHRGLLPDEGDVDPQRRAHARLAPLRRRPRRLRVRGGRRAGDPGVPAARGAARRPDLRRGVRLRDDRRRPPHDRAGSRGRRRGAEHGRGAARRQPRADRRRLHQRPRHLDARTTTSSRPSRSSASSATTPASSRCPRPSR